MSKYKTSEEVTAQNDINLNVELTPFRNWKAYYNTRRVDVRLKSTTYFQSFSNIF